MSPTRRSVLAGAAAVALAGCAQSNDDSGGDDGDGGGNDGESSPTDAASPTGSPTRSPTDTPRPTGDPTASPAPTPTPTRSPTPTATPATPRVTVRVRSHPDFGGILVGPDGMTLYMFDQDTRGEGASTCYDSCAGAWPPLTVDGSPTAGEDVTASLDAFEREGGESQVTANGWPLYYFVNDGDPGDANGQGVKDIWWVLGPDGTPKRSPATTATDSATATAAPTTTDSGDSDSGGDDSDGSGDDGVY